MQVKYETPDPIAVIELLWPHVRLYDKQKEIVYSVWHNDLTVVPAGHMLGKDFIAGLICLAFFMTRTPCRIITTSVDATQLEGVLWGEIRRFISESKAPLDAEQGGPLIINHCLLRQVPPQNKGVPCGLSYVRGRVAAKGEGMSGHHIAKTGDGIPRTLAICDEASGLDDETISKMFEWADRILIIGNPYQCSNMFRYAVKGDPRTLVPGGDQPRENGQGYYRRIIQIKATDSPNVKLGLQQQAQGIEPTDEIVLPGVLSWADYVKRRRTWDPVKQAVGLDAEFHDGAEQLLFPSHWLDHAGHLARALVGQPRYARGIGIDTGEGTSKTSMCAVDDRGIIELVAYKTPDTAKIPGDVLGFIRRHRTDETRICCDRGGGGKQLADRLRQLGMSVNTIDFGQSIIPPVRRYAPGIKTRLDEREEKSVYVNRRAQMYGELSLLLDPSGTSGGFAIPESCFEVRRQLAPIPRTYDAEGRLYLLPKSKRDPKSKQRTLIDILGCSPDEADSLVLSVHSMLHEHQRPRVYIS